MNFRFTITYSVVFLAMLLASLFYKKPREDVKITPIFEIKPNEYKIYEVTVKEGMLDFKIEIPVTTELKLRVLDPEGNELQKLIDEKSFPKGVYNIKCHLNSRSSGKYKCNLETKDFIYETDFFIN
ncbi:MAG: hypothetical protein N2510_01395 [Ignavibacteria bacterium]|nr:hypothetical protein [Ignavibacteria bacterium]